MAFNFSDLLAEAKGEKPVTWASDAKEEVEEEPASASRVVPSAPLPLSCSEATSSSTRQPADDDDDEMSSNKRASQYKHGQPGSEFVEERPEDPADEPKRATAAQLAARKIKTLKGARRPAGASSGLSAFNPNPPSANSFNFGPDPNAGAAPSNPFAPQQQQSAPGGNIFGQSQQQDSPGGSIFGFGSNSASSFPPAQSSAPSNPFAQSTTSSFPPASGFGGLNTGSPSSFNPQPDMNFGNIANGFGASAPAPSSGFSFGAQSSQAPAFAASQNNTASTPASNGFSFLGAAAKNNESTSASGGLFNNTNNASTSAPSGGVFSPSTTPQNNLFGGFNSNATTGTNAPASPFGNPFDKAKDTSTSFQFGASTQPSTTAEKDASTPKALFGGISGATPVASSAEASKPSFGNFGSISQTNATTQAPTNSFGPNTAATDSSTLFNTSTPGFSFGASSSGLGGPTSSTQGDTTTTPAFSFGNPAAKPAMPSPSANMFGNQGTNTQESTSSGAPVSFGGFGQISEAQPPSMPATLGLFSEPQVQAPTGPIATPIGESSNTGSSTIRANKRPLFANSQYVNFQFSNTRKMSDGPVGLLTSLPRPPPRRPRKNSNDKDILPPNAFSLLKKKKIKPLNNDNQKSNMLRNPTSEVEPTEASQEPTETSQEPLSETTTQTTLETTPFQPSRSIHPAQTEKAPSNPFASLSSSGPAPSSSNASFFSSVKPAVPTSNPSSNGLFTPAKPATLTPKPAVTAAPFPAQEATKNVPPPQIPRVAVPKSWTIPDNCCSDLHEHTKLLEKINEIYRTKVAQLPPRADWSALSKWHWEESSKLKKKIDNLRKQAAAAKGITGEETVLSTKRRTDDSAQLESPFKKARSSGEPTTPNAKVPALPSTTPKANPPAKPFNLFSNTSTAQQATSATDGTLGSENNTAATGGFKPNLPTSTSSTASGFKPSFGTSSNAGGSTGGGFFGQFGGKTKEQLRDERMKKALEEGYESPTTSEEAEGDYETREQFLARWNKEEDERQASLDAAAKNTTFRFAPTTSKNTDTPTFKFTAPSSGSIAASQGFGSGASTPGLFGSRVSSPAPSVEGARSVLDTPLGAQTPTSNLFGHLSATSSQHQDDSDDDADDESAAQPSIEEEPKKRKLGEVGDAESEISETLEESMRRKKPATQTSSFFNRVTKDNSEVEEDPADTATKKPSLLDRMTRDNSEAASDVTGKDADPHSLNSVNSKLYNINGSQTPAPKKPFTFDFAAAAKTAPQSAPPKQNPFAGDQTFKFGDPIKFGSSSNANTPFTITPATPTPASPVPQSIAPPKAMNSPFAFLSAAPSAATSAMSSRAATPASDADASATEGAAINEEEGQNHVESDKSTLSSEEQAEFDVLFEAEQVIANKQMQKQGADKPEWVRIANGRLWILKSKTDNHVILRLRMKSGAVRVNIRIPPVIKSTIMGANKTQVLTKEASVKDGKTILENLIFAFNHKDKETKQQLAQKFSETYNENVPGA